MKAKAILLTLGLVAAVFGAQQATTLQRTYKEGEKDSYKMHMDMTMSVGDANVSMVMNQTVKKVYDNGDADLETAFDDFHVMFGGNEVPAPAPPATTERVNKFGLPVEAKKAEGMGRMQFLRLNSAFAGKPLVVGQVITLDQADPKDPKSKVTGTAKVDSIENGIATITSDMNVFSAAADTPMKVHMVGTFDTLSSKPVKMEGTATDVVSPQGAPPITSMKFTIERVM